MTKIKWISAIDPSNINLLEDFQKKMANYYATNDQYYHDIDDGIHKWNDNTYLPMQKIKDIAFSSKSMLEVGCGRANILSRYPELENKYSGLDFSPDLIQNNQKKYPAANFKNIVDPQIIPFPDNSFDFVFSIFVIEHVVFPHTFIDECLRVLKQGGTLIILCPDYAGHNWMASQKAGFSAGTGRDKMKQHKYIDAFMTLIDSRIIIPIASQYIKMVSRTKPGFYINTDPTCFSHPFKPDVDAVYVTNASEITEYTKGKISWNLNASEMNLFIKKNRLIFLEGIKV